MPTAFACHLLGVAITALLTWPRGMAVPMGVGGVVARAEDPMDRLQKLKTMLVKGLISQAEYDNKKAEILAAL